MLEINKFEDELLPVIDELKLSKEEILLFAKSDMQGEKLLGECLLFLTADNLYAVSGQTKLVGNGHGHLKTEFSKSSVQCFDTDKIENIRIESMISSAVAIASVEKKPKIVCFSTNRCKNDLQLFSKYFNKYKENGEIVVDENDFKKEAFCPKCGGRYPDPVRKICPKCMDKKGLFKRFLPLLKEYRFSVLLIVFTLILVSALSIVAPYFSSAFFYNEVLNIGGKFYGKILLVLTIVVLTTVLQKAVNALSGCISSVVAGKVVYDLKKKIFSSINRLSMSFFTGRQTGGLMTQINNDANSIYWFFVEGIPYYLINAVQFVAILVLMLIMNPLLAVLCLTVTPLFFAIISRVMKKMNTLQSKRYLSHRAMNSTLSDSIAGIRVVKAFAREDEECKRFASRSIGFEEKNRDVTVYNNTAFPVANTVMYFCTLIAWGVGGWMVMSGYHGMQYGTLLTFITYAGMLSSPLMTFVNMSQSLSEWANALQRLFEIADAEPDVRESETPVELDEVVGRVEFDNIEFSYTKERKIIDKVSFDVEAGQCLGIVGHSGAGKSTLANLLIRLYDVTEGEIRIDGVNVKDLRFDTLRKNIAIVSQETYHFAGSILDNIRYAKPEATYDEVISAAKVAGAHDFIVKLPDGYDTHIGSGGKSLSGGERQRLSIARAILKDPKILILDEATAAMDTETERKIQNALEALSRGRTTITIAHRLSTLRGADKLIVIENGKMVESGTHRELLEKRGIYHRLYKLQAEAMKNIGIEE